MIRTVQQGAAALVAALLSCALALLRWWAATLLAAALAGAAVILHGWLNGLPLLFSLMVAVLLLGVHAAMLLAALLAVAAHEQLCETLDPQALTSLPFDGREAAEERLLVGE